LEPCGQGVVEPVVDLNSGDQSTGNQQTLGDMTFSRSDFDHVIVSVQACQANDSIYRLGTRKEILRCPNWATFLPFVFGHKNTPLSEFSHRKRCLKENAVTSASSQAPLSASAKNTEHRCNSAPMSVFAS
jgi:hypothetical protein